MADRIESPPRGAEAGSRFAVDIGQSLTRQPRELPSRYFYDALGSSLFDAICHLPWYRITRAESRLLAAHRDAIHRLLEPLARVVELGPGNGEKLKLLLEGAGHRRAPIDLHLVDVSNRARQTAAQALDAVANVRIVTHAAEYTEGLRAVASAANPSDGRTLVLFLGSNIGNFDRSCAAALLENICGSLVAGDALLLGTDLVKPEPELVLAYDDPLGVTAAFNRNLLLRINTELEGDFDVHAFAHEAVWNAAESRMEMYLVARSAQRVRIAAVPLEFTMRAGERIWTESSYKYRPRHVAAILAEAGFRTLEQWIDEEDGFMVTLAEVAASVRAGERVAE
jgi:dimethylhistidine N-methyltransferase